MGQNFDGMFPRPGLSAGAIAGIVIGVVVFIALVVIFLVVYFRWLKRLRNKITLILQKYNDRFNRELAAIGFRFETPAKIVGHGTLVRCTTNTYAGISQTISTVRNARQQVITGGSVGVSYGNVGFSHGSYSVKEKGNYQGLGFSDVANMDLDAYATEHIEGDVYMLLYLDRPASEREIKSLEAVAGAIARATRGGF